jgi:hypothetical protein
MIEQDKNITTIVCAYRKCGKPMQKGRDFRRAKYCSAECRRAALYDQKANAICWNEKCKRPFKTHQPFSRHPKRCPECRAEWRKSKARKITWRALDIPQRPFTEFERGFVSANYYTIPSAEIAAMLGRNKGSITSVYNRLLKPGRAAAA